MGKTRSESCGAAAGPVCPANVNAALRADVLAGCNNRMIVPSTRYGSQLPDSHSICTATRRPSIWIPTARPAPLRTPGGSRLGPSAVRRSRPTHSRSSARSSVHRQPASPPWSSTRRGHMMHSKRRRAPGARSSSCSPRPDRHHPRRRPRRRRRQRLAQRRGPRTPPTSARWPGPGSSRVGRRGPVNGTDANVQAAICTRRANGVYRRSRFGSPTARTTSDETGAISGPVGSGAIPAGTAGVTVNCEPDLASVLARDRRHRRLDAPAERDGQGWVLPRRPPRGTCLPGGISLAFFQTYPFCSGPVGQVRTCYPQHLTPGNLNVPGGFGWLKFGAIGSAPASGSDDDDIRLRQNKPFLQEEIGPPVEQLRLLHGGRPATGSGPHRQPARQQGQRGLLLLHRQRDHRHRADLGHAGGNGANAWYHIVGFAGFQLTACEGGKDIEGVWRNEIGPGPDYHDEARRVRGAGSPAGQVAKPTVPPPAPLGR